MVTRTVRLRAEETLAYEAPWYDMNRWMQIRQGEAEGCRYDAAQEVDTGAAALEDIISQDQQAEWNEQ